METEVSITAESNLELIINGKFRISMLISPMNIEAFVVGYLITEGIVKSYKEIKTIEYRDEGQISVMIDSAAENINNMELDTSGGVGIKLLSNAIFRIPPSDMRITPEIIFNAQAKLIQSSILWRKTGGTHMAGLFNSDGTMVYYAEDCGRHNAIDKIIGQALLDLKTPSSFFMAFSGRLSAAMVSKIARAGIPIVISKAAPLAKGLEIGRNAGMTLVGFARSPEMNIYCNPDRIQFKKGES
jgi:FdhD protein